MNVIDVERNMHMVEGLISYHMNVATFFMNDIRDEMEDES